MYSCLHSCEVTLAKSVPGKDIATDTLHVLRGARAAAVAGVRALRRWRARRSCVLGATVSVRHTHLELFVSPVVTLPIVLSPFFAAKSNTS